MSGAVVPLPGMMMVPAMPTLGHAATLAANLALAAFMVLGVARSDRFAGRLGSRRRRSCALLAFVARVARLAFPWRRWVREAAADASHVHISRLISILW